MTLGGGLAKRERNVSDLNGKFTARLKDLLGRYDCILMLKNGRLCERGSFEELMSKKGQFYALFTVANG